MRTTDAQVRKLMEELSKGQEIGVAARKAGVHRATARKYRDLEKLPSELVRPRTWRTREDPLAEAWPKAVEMLEGAPDLEAKALFGHLAEEHGLGLEEAHLRTFQRRVREWRARHGPPKEVFFPQQHRPGEAMQTDFTAGDKLEVTIDGDPYSHLICHMVLPYSNWEWVTLARSESMAALRRGVQSAVFTLGKTPTYHQTDNSSAATHNLPARKRGFNEEYRSLMTHLNMEPRTIVPYRKEQNGDVEASNRAFKARVKQHLLLRGGRDFASRDEYESWLQGVAMSANRLRTRRLQEELKHMTVLNVKRLPEWTEERVSVTSYSTIKVKRNTYSVPSRLIGETLRVRIYDDRLELYHGTEYQFTVPRLIGNGRHCINYRHVIDTLIRKPGAFERYRYREDLFPTLTFRRAYDCLHRHCTSRVADYNYLRLLHLAATTMESEVEAAVDLVLQEGQRPLADEVKELVSDHPTEVPDLVALAPDLLDYDDLLEVVEVSA
jgi:hypothetical protein